MYLILKQWEGKYNMRVMMLLIIITLMTMAVAKSEGSMDSDNRNPGKDKVNYDVCESKTSWLEKNWCETVEFQKQGFNQSKIDLSKSKEDLKNLPGNTVNFVKQTPENVSNFVKDTSNGISNWASDEWNSIKDYQKKAWSK